MTTVENVTIAKKAYETFFNINQRNFNLTIRRISVDEQNRIKEDLLSKNYWWEHALTDLDLGLPFLIILENFLDQIISLMFHM